MKKICLLLTAIILISSCKKEGCTDELALNYDSGAEINNGTCEYYIATEYIINYPEGFPTPVIPINNPLTNEGVSLGEKLFNDPILSVDGTISCSSCHLKSSNFSDPNKTSIGFNGSEGFRNASTITNSIWSNSFNWDGSELTLENQAFEPVTNPNEMNNTWENVENILNSNDEYQRLFKLAFNIDYIDSVHVVKAISQYERSLVSFNSKFDKFYRGEGTLSSSELNGYAIFNSEKGDCFHCHGTMLFTDNLFHNNGLDSEEPFDDNGLGLVTNNPADYGKFKTPSLRNIEYSAPYMHDGRFSSLEEVINHYNDGGHYSSTVDPLMKKIGVGLELTNQEISDLIAFLKTLSDENFISKK